MLFSNRPFVMALIVAAISINSAELLAQNESAPTTRSSRELKTAVKQAFQDIHDGWSSDEVILNDKLYKAFIDRCSSLFGSELPEQFGWTLLNLRKAGDLDVKTTRRKTVLVDSVADVAEIAARSITDRHSVSTDRVMVSPEFRSQFDQLARELDPKADLYLVRRAAFKLRKTRRLQPELIARIVDWGRKIEQFSTQEILDAPEIIPEHPGVYIFRDRSGYLYIGQSENLRERLQTHLNESHSFSLARYLSKKGFQNVSVEIHSFAPDSRAKETRIRRAYESELIASRKPRFNIQP